MKAVDDLAQLPATELVTLPALEGLGDRHESPPELFLVRVCGLLTQEALDPLGSVCQAFSLSTLALTPWPPRSASPAAC